MIDEIREIIALSYRRQDLWESANRLEDIVILAQ